MGIRVRFAPSPTGLLHIGNARTALINWLFARHHILKGEEATFLLRLDDTDPERSEDRYAQAIEKDLAWLGLSWDAFARQSDRFEAYARAIDRLKASGRLYPCYETPEELDFKRKRQLARHEPPIYDRAALQLTDAQRRAFEAEGRRPHWRFYLLPETIQWEDMTRGTIVFQSSHLSDPVLVRADDAYLYTLTSVVDDIDLDITHILRGEDHVTNTAVQIQLFAALGANLSTLHFAHTTKLVDAQGGSLSKRLGSLSLGSVREMGLEPMALNSLLARLGTSLPVEPQVTLDALAASFTLSIFSRTPPRFDPEDLKTLNHKLLQIMPYDKVQDSFRQKGLSPVTETLWNAVRGNLQTLEEARQWEDICTKDILPISTDQTYLMQALSCLPEEPWDQATWALWTGKIKEISGRKGKDLFMPLRQALTGKDHGPEMKELLLLIGYNKVRKRLKR